MPQAPIQIALEQSDILVIPGNRIEIPFRLVNYRDQPDFIEVTVRGIPASWVIITDPVVQVGARDQARASIYVLPPVEESSTVGVFPFYLRAQSQEMPDAFAEATINLRVGSFEFQGRISVLIDELNYAVEPGGTVTVPFVLQNQGLTEDTVTLEMDGIPVMWVTTNTPVVELRPGESRPVQLVIQPPRTPLSRAGRNPFSILVVSQADPGQVVRVDGLLTVAAYSQYISDLTPRRVERDQPARLRILNQGNVQDTYRIDWASQNDALEFITAQPLPLRAQPGETAFLDFEVRRRGQHWFGGVEMFPYTLSITPASSQQQAHTGEYLSRAIIPVWVIPIITLVCLAMICAGGYFWNRFNGGLGGASLTATAQSLAWVTQTAQVAAATQTASFNMTAAALAGQTDSDGDGITNQDEANLGTNPNQADSDNDRLNDGEEVRQTLNPLNPDTDGDGLIDGLDLDPLDPANPRLTATALAALPTGTNVPTPTTPAAATLAPAPTLTFTLPPAATSTFTAVPTTPPVLPSATPAALALPENSVLAFESNRSGSPDIFLLAPALGDIAALAPSPQTDSQPAWSPDGQRLVFVSNRDGNNEIYITNFDGSGLANLTNNPANDQFPAWSPDGGAIVFTSDRDGNNEIYRMGVDGSNPANLTNNPAQDEHPSWYAQGGASRIVFSTNRDGNNEIYQMDDAGGSLANLSNHPASDTLPSAPRVGGRVAFVSDRDGNLEIYAIGTDGSGLTNLTNNPAGDAFPAWSPDGAWLAFTTDRDGNAEIYVMSASGQGAVNVTNDPAQDLYPTWR